MATIYISFDTFMPVSGINISAICSSLGNPEEWCIAHPPSVFASSARLFAVHVHFIAFPTSFLELGAADVSEILRSTADLEVEHYVHVISAQFAGTRPEIYVYLTIIYISILFLMGITWKIQNKYNFRKIERTTQQD